MEYTVITNLEIDGEKFDNFSSLTLKQAYHDHHKFEVIFKQSSDFFVSASDVNDFIGKPVIISYGKLDGSNIESCYEFHGFILEVEFSKTGAGYPDFILIGYSNTIKLEEGCLRSFVDKSVEKIVDEVINGKIDYEVHLTAGNSPVLNYACQYEETSFHFLRYFSMWAGGNMHYNGTKLYFGSPPIYLIIDEDSNYDLLSIRMNLKISPQQFGSHFYDPGQDKLLTAKSTHQQEKIGKNSAFLQSESNNFFSGEPPPVFTPINTGNQRVLDEVVRMQQLALAADLQSISGSSHNPKIAIGRILRVRPPGGNYEKQDSDYESYLITKVDHFTEDGDRYFNRFEGIPFVDSKTFVLDNGRSVIDGKFEPCIAYPQAAIVTDNNDPEKQGRVKVQMFWQQQNNETTNWIRVMTPDAGSGKGGASNRGFVAIPEKGDQVMLDFEHGLPDYPFVLGGMFHGKSGGGGGQGNSVKSLTHKSGSHVSLIDTRIDMCDASGNYIQIDGTDTIKISASAKIEIKVGGSVLEITPSKISLTAQHIEINGTIDAKMFSGAAEFKTQNGGNADMKGTVATVDGQLNSFLKGGVGTHITGTLVEIEASGPTTVKGATVKIN